MTCHFMCVVICVLPMCGAGETKSPCKSYADKKRPKKGKD